MAMPMTSVAKTTTETRARIARDPASLGPAIHPGEMLLEEFIAPLGLQQTVLARELDISKNRLNEIILGKRGVTADTAIRLSERFGTTPQFWMRLQADWDLQVALKERKRTRARR
jgi:antitoxin HigA-1